MTHKYSQAAVTTAILASFLCACSVEEKQGYSTWEVYRGDASSNAYSRLSQINRQNVKQLKPVWTYRTGDASQHSTVECNPIIVNKVLFGISPALKTFAVNAVTGKQLWVFDPFDSNSKGGGFNRGLAYWQDGEEQRIFMFASNKLIALDARTGKQINTFGEEGYVDLNKGLGRAGEGVGNTSPGIIYKDLIITGSAVGENYESAPGHIRAYDVRTGEQKWIFHTVPEPGEFGYDTWSKEGNATSGGCNAWSGLSLDTKRGIVFVATGSPAFDFHGGERIGINLFGNSVIALDAASGKRIWHFQITHHDIWDYDLPSPPNLIIVEKDGKALDAVAQITKQGFIFVFDRETGEPLFPIEEIPVPRTGMPDEQNWPTQPVPVKPLPLSRQAFDESVITDISPESHAFVLNEARKFQWGSMYLPPSVDGTIEIPGMRGGAEWSGACFDIETGMLYVGINELPGLVQLLEEKENNEGRLSNMPMIQAGEIFYQKKCAVCHGDDRKGNNSFPSLVDIGSRFKPDEVKALLQKTRGVMPSFSTLPTQDTDAILSFLFNLENKGVYKTQADQSNAPAGTRKRYSLKGYTYLRDQDGYPGVKPPWGTLNAVNMNSGEIVWKIPLGEYPELSAKGLPVTGTTLFGGGIVTAGGLIFIAASQDEKFRAIDKASGEILWEYQLPCGGYATPSTYEVDGRQYVVIAAGGGGRQGTKSGDYYIAFALQP